MKIVGRDSNLYVPCVPSYLVTDDGKILLKDGRLLDRQEGDEEDWQNFPEPVTIQSGEWVAALEDGSAHVLAPGEEEKWRAETAMDLVSKVTNLKQSAPVALNLIFAASALVGLSLGELWKKLEQERKSPNESFQDIFKRFRDEGKPT